MNTSHVAFGLTLRCSFPLPGIDPDRAAGLPSLAVDLVAPAELDAAWSGAGDRQPWRGRLGDGETLTIAPGAAGDLLFGYGERARFRLAAARDRLECAPADPADLAWQRVLCSRVLPNVSISFGREALHASAVESPLGAVAIAAPSGTGKSTLAAQLVRRGWPLFSDDILILERRPEGVRAHPGAPQMNLLGAAAAGAKLGTRLGVLAGEDWTAVDNHARRARKVAAIFFLERGPELALESRDLPSSPLALAPYMLGRPDGGDREDRRFAIYSDLVDSTALIGLSANTTDEPPALADALERALGLGAALAVEERA